MKVRWDPLITISMRGDLMAEAGNNSGKTLLVFTTLASSSNSTASQRGWTAQGAVRGARYLVGCWARWIHGARIARPPNPWGVSLCCVGVHWWNLWWRHSVVHEWVRGGRTRNRCGVVLVTRIVKVRMTAISSTDKTTRLWSSAEWEGIVARRSVVTCGLLR